MQKLINIPLFSPLSKGLNTQEVAKITGPQWATVASNCVFDAYGRLVSRKGWSKVNSNDITNTIKVIHEYVNLSGNKEIISTAGNKIYSGTTTLTDKTGALTPTADDWSFVNFYGNVLGFQDSHTPIVYTGTGNFANITFAYPTAGTNTFSGISLAAFGRIWSTTSNKRVIKYSALLDETSWTDDSGGNGNSAQDAGIIDLSSVWPSGMDEVVALAEFNNYLVIFGQNAILFYAGADDPLNMYRADALDNIGCVARDSVQNIGTDLIFVSKTGIESLSRAILQKSTPIDTLSKYVRDNLVIYITNEDPTLIKSTYNKKYGLVLFTFPTYNTTYVLDVRVRGQDPIYRITTWDSINPHAVHSAEDDTLYLGQAGYLGKYDSYSDDTAEYLMEVKSGWFDISTYAPEWVGRKIILKRILTTVNTGFNNTVTTTWAYDFEGQQGSQSNTFTASGIAEYGIAEYGEDEWAGGATTVSLKNNTTGDGFVVQIGARAYIGNSAVALHKFDIQLKIGRSA